MIVQIRRELTKLSQQEICQITIISNNNDFKIINRSVLSVIRPLLLSS